MTDYKSYAPCGFCKHYGSVFAAYKEDVCRDCEVRRIRSALETLENAALWEHDHKYRADSDAVVRNCAHCNQRNNIEQRDYRIFQSLSMESWTKFRWADMVT